MNHNQANIIVFCAVASTILVFIITLCIGYIVDEIKLLKKKTNEYTSTKT